MDILYSFLAGFALVLMPSLALRSISLERGRLHPAFVISMLVIAIIASLWLMFLSIPAGLVGLAVGALLRGPLLGHKHDFVVKEPTSDEDLPEPQESPSLDR